MQVTASYLKDLDILGADPSLPKYLVHDDRGNYATFDKGKNIVYFQPSVPTIEHWDVLLKDTQSTRNRFASLLDDLLKNPGISANGAQGCPQVMAYSGNQLFPTL